MKNIKDKHLFLLIVILITIILLYNNRLYESFSCENSRMINLYLIKDFIKNKKESLTRGTEIYFTDEREAIKDSYVNTCDNNNNIKTLSNRGTTTTTASGGAQQTTTTSNQQTTTTSNQQCTIDKIMYLQDYVVYKIYYDILQNLENGLDNIIDNNSDKCANDQGDDDDDEEEEENGDGNNECLISNVMLVDYVVGGTTIKKNLSEQLKYIINNYLNNNIYSSSDTNSRLTRNLFKLGPKSHERTYGKLVSLINEFLIDLDQTHDLCIKYLFELSETITIISQ